MDCSLPGFSVHGISQARILEWAAISFSRGSSQLRDQTQVCCTAGRLFTAAPLGKLRDAAKAALLHLAGVLTARTLGLLAIPASSGFRFVRALHYDLSILGSPRGMAQSFSELCKPLHPR